MKAAARGRADLIRALAAGGEAWLNDVASLLGYECRPAAIDEAADAERAVRHAEAGGLWPTDASATAQPASTTNGVALAPKGIVDVPFWRPSRFTAHDRRLSAPLPARLPVAWENRPNDLPTPRPLTSPSALLTRLRRTIAVSGVSRRVDLKRVVGLLARGCGLQRMPRARRLRWGSSLRVVCDRSLRLVPYWRDQDRALMALSRLYPTAGLEIGVGDDVGRVRLLSRTRRQACDALSPRGVRTLVLGDLGCLDTGSDGRATAAWAKLGRQWGSHGLTPVVLLPCGPGRLVTAPPRAFRLLAHEPASASVRQGVRQSAAARDAAAQQLLTWLAPAVRIQPELLRKVRMELGQGAIHAGIESIVWQHPGVATRHPAGMSLQPAEAHAQRKRFAGQSESVRRAALASIRAFRGGSLPDSLWFEELLALDAESQPLVPQGDIDAARSYVRHETLPALLASASDPARFGMLRWLGALDVRLPREAWQGPGARALRQSWMVAHAGGPRTAPFDEDPKEARALGWPERRVRLAQSGDALVFSADGEPCNDPMSPLATMRAGFPRMRLERRAGFWGSGIPPAWASAWGRDEFGPWADVDVASVRVRLRWIPPGRFLMGSPESETGRWSDEGPQHEVAIGRGFWLFETPCTQRLWEAVMGDNPSRFQGPDYPVERVSWEACRMFLTRVNERVPGLGLVLPSEAQWEYACRAATETATYAGGNDAATLDAIAWYEANAGGQTHPVGQKQPNTWGLHDMLGSVLEWVEDAWHDSYRGAPADGTAWVDSKRGSARVGRGGSWYSHARRVRAASRDWNAPDVRYSNLGFRCARVQDTTEPAGPREDRSAERRSSVGEGATASIWVGPGGDQPQRVEGSALLLVESDLETLELERLTRPAWASAIGRDRFGLWTEFELPTQTGFTTQRMRWIPPGRFRMGSPADEPGRSESEGPQHEVTLERGFWLFDTPCTQALWEAVMGARKNPSRFQTSDRPVENVNWDDCRRFLERVNERAPGLSLVLPSEAQWEYACRAGTETATYAGAMELLGANNAPVLHEIAWYGGNSGVDFDLDNGVDSSKWPEKQYEHTRAGTRAVGRKRPNVWGLYDMLGNVWEWVQDEWHDSYEGAPPDGSTWADGQRGSARVLRGGSWNYYARSVRAAYRLRLAPDDRYDSLGFRCARVQDTAEPAGPREDRSAERRSSAEPHDSKKPGRGRSRRPGRQVPK